MYSKKATKFCKIFTLVNIFQKFCGLLRTYEHFAQTNPSNFSDKIKDNRLVHVLWYEILGHYFGMILQYFGWKLSKQTSYWPKTVFFSQLEIKWYFHPKLLWYHPKTTYKNILQRDMNKFNEVLLMVNI